MAVKKGDNDPVAAAQRAAQATRYRTAGMTYQQIADTMGYADRSSVRQLILTHAQRDLRESVDEMRQIENERLDIVTTRMLTIIGNREKSDIEAIRASDTLIRTSARRATLNGLDKPISIQVMGRAQAALAELTEFLMALPAPDGPLALPSA